MSKNTKIIAIVGGVLEYSAMVLGIKALYLVAVACYLAVLLTTWRRTGVMVARAGP